VVRQTVIAFWLIPAEPAHSFFQEIISNLARRYDSLIFEPHVTLHVGADCADLAEKALGCAELEPKRIRLKPVGVDHSGEFIKTLFVQFALDPELRQLSEMIRKTTHDPLKYELKPHLSLLYKSMSAATRRGLAASITVPFSEVGFGALQAIRCVSPTQTAADVEAWQFLGARRLAC
jgi:2'-5' RNA ligase